MAITDLIILGIVIGSNNLAVSFALGAMKSEKYHLRIVLAFGFFEFIIPLVGLLSGRFFAQVIEDYATLVGSVILMALGLFSVAKSVMAKDQTQKISAQITSYKGIISLAMALSMDNLMVGFSLGLKDVPPVLLAGVIASFSVVFAFVGLKTGRFLSKKSRFITEISAGLLLIFLAIAIYLGWF